MAPSFWTKLKARVAVSWKKTDENLEHSIRDVLTQLGCLEPQENQDNGFLHFRYWLPHFSFTFSMFLSLVLSSISIYQFRDMDVIKIMEPTAAAFIIWTLVVNVGTFLYRQETFKVVVKTFKEMKAFDSEENKHSPSLDFQLKWLSTLAKRYFIALVLVSLPSLLVGYPIYAFQKRDLAFRYWFPYDFQTSPYFEITLAILVLNLAFGASICFLTNTLIFSLLSETIGQLYVLNVNFKQCIKKREEDQGKEPSSTTYLTKFSYISVTQNELKNSINDQYNFQRLKNPGILGLQESSFLVETRDQQEINENTGSLRKCIQHHHAVIRFMTAFDDAFHLILVQSYISSVAPCILGVVAITYASEYDSRLFIITGLVIIQLINQGIFCWLGEQINEQHALLRDAVFGCDWLRASEGFKRSMRIVMSRSNQPLIIHMAGFIPLNLQALLQVLQLIYSYYMSLTATLKINQH